MNDEQLRKIDADPTTFVDDTCNLRKWKEAQRDGTWRNHPYMVNRLAALTGVYHVHNTGFAANVGIIRK